VKTFNLLGGRKLIGFVAVFTVLTVKIFLDGADTKAIIDGLIFALGIYVGGNALEHISDGFGKKGGQDVKKTLD
jgi:hypothetical protein